MRQYISNQFPVKPKVKSTTSSLWYQDGNVERLIRANKPFALLQSEKKRLSNFGYVLSRFKIHH